MPLQNHDPDSYLLSLRTKAKVDKFLCEEEDYITEYLLRECMELSEAGAKDKSDQIKRLGEVIEHIKDDTLRGVYYDNIAEDWPSFKKGYKLKKRKDTAGVAVLNKLKKDDRASHYKDGFFEENNAYYAIHGDSKKRLCNFSIEILYFVRTSENPKYVCRITNMFGKSCNIAITTDDFTSTGTFSKAVAKFGNYIFEGNQADLNKIRIKLFHGVKEAIEPKYMGQHNNDFFVWANGLLYRNEMHKSDKYGMSELKVPIKTFEQFKKLPPESQLKMGNDIIIITFIDEFIEEQGEEVIKEYIEKEQAFQLKYFYLPFASSLKLSDQDESEDNYQFERMFKCPNSNANITFNQWAELMVSVYGDNGMIGIAFYIMALFRDIVFKANNSYIPMLGCFGPKQSGKSTMARSLCMMYGDCLTDGLNLESGSTATAAGRYLASYANGIIWLNEYKNSLPDYILGMIKGIADGNGKITGRKTSGNEIKVTRPRSTAIISGQDLPTKDPAIFSRAISLEFDGGNRNYAKFEELKELQDSGQLPAITCQLLKYRKEIETYYPEIATNIVKMLRSAYAAEETRIEDRVMLNMASLSAPIYILQEAGVIKLPFEWDKFSSVLEAKIKKQLAIQSTADDVEQYFTVLMSMVGREIHEHVHYKIEKGPDGIAKLFIRVSSFHAAYQSAANRSGINAMTLGTIKSYLEKHHSFIEDLKKNVKFNNLSNRTSAMVFNYDKLRESEIEFSTAENLETVQPSMGF